MKPVLSIQQLNKTYAGGLTALNDINLDIHKGEIFALLGPNGAGKTTLIGSVCGVVNPTSGRITVNGHDINKDYRLTRQQIGLVPQELTIEMFEPVWDTVNFSRGLFGLPPKPVYIEKILKNLSLWDKRKNKIMTLSGGMKRRVMIAKALSHEPQVLFLDEPTAGVDVELRQDMWTQVKELKKMGVTVILTTHYIEEAEEMADRIGVINKGQLIVTEDKKTLMAQFGRKHLTVDLMHPLKSIPRRLQKWDLHLCDEGRHMTYIYDPTKEEHGICELMGQLSAAGIEYKDIHTEQSSLEEIFIQLVRSP